LIWAVPLIVWAGSPGRWIVAVYCAPFVATSMPKIWKDGPQRGLPPAYGFALLIVPVIVVVPELIAKGIASFSCVLPALRERLAVALVSVKLPA
jgi:hypothetical protein